MKHKCKNNECIAKYDKERLGYHCFICGSLFIDADICAGKCEHAKAEEQQPVENTTDKV